MFRIGYRARSLYIILLFIYIFWKSKFLFHFFDYEIPNLFAVHRNIMIHLEFENSLSKVLFC